MEKRYVRIGENEVYYYLNKKKIRNINIRIKPDGNVYLSCPLKMKPEEAEKFLIQKYDWIVKQQNRLEKYSAEKENYEFKNGGKPYFMGKLYTLNIFPNKSNNVELLDDSINIFIKEKYIENIDYIQKYYEKWLKEQAFEVYKNLVIKYQNQMSKYVKSFPQIEVKKLKTRWGSCMPTRNKVTFNLSLIKTPYECIEYVVVHELAHFKHQNHSKKFYNLVEIYIPDWKERRKLLNSKYNIVV